MDSGSSSRRMPRVTSTQKLPSLSVRDLVKPRIIAIATARPTAADRNCCTTSPVICTMYVIVDSPA